MYNSGSHRVMGMLAMSRAIGDHFLRPYVIAEPEVGGSHLFHHVTLFCVATCFCLVVHTGTACTLGYWVQRCRA